MMGILEELGLLPDWVVPPPVGLPPQVEEVTVNTATNAFEWIVTGNASQIDHFVADIILIRPDLPVPFVESSSQPLILPASARSASYLSFILNADMPTFDQASRSYRAIRIAIVPTDRLRRTSSAIPIFLRHQCNPSSSTLTRWVILVRDRWA